MGGSWERGRKGGGRGTRERREEEIYKKTEKGKEDGRGEEEKGEEVEMEKRLSAHWEG